MEAVPSVGWSFQRPRFFGAGNGDDAIGGAACGGSEGGCIGGGGGAVGDVVGVVNDEITDGRV